MVFGKGGAKVDGTQWETSRGDDTKHIVAFSKDSVYIQLNDLIFKDTYTVKGDTVYLGEVTTENHYPKFYHDWGNRADLNINGTDKGIVTFEASRPDNQLLEQFANAPSNPIIPKQKYIVASDLLLNNGSVVDFRSDWKENIRFLGFKLVDSDSQYKYLENYYEPQKVCKNYYLLSQDNNDIYLVHEYIDYTEFEDGMTIPLNYSLKFNNSVTQQKFINSLINFGYSYQGTFDGYQYYGKSGIGWKVKGRKVVSF